MTEWREIVKKDYNETYSYEVTSTAVSTQRNTEHLKSGQRRGLIITSQLTG